MTTSSVAAAAVLASNGGRVMGIAQLAGGLYAVVLDPRGSYLRDRFGTVIVFRTYQEARAGAEAHLAMLCDIDRLERWYQKGNRP